MLSGDTNLPSPEYKLREKIKVNRLREKAKHQTEPSVIMKSLKLFEPFNVQQ